MSGERTVFAELDRQAADRLRPLRALLELTHRCNFRCVHCYCLHDRPGEELSTDEWRGVLDELAGLGVLFLTLSGGEPLLRRDFFEIAAHARRRRFALRVFTNASLVTERNADRLARLAPKEVEVSIYGASAATYEAVAGQGGFAGQARRGVERLLARGIRPLIKLPILRENLGDLEALAAWARGLGLRLSTDHRLIPRDDGSHAPSDHALDEEALAGLLAADLAAGGTPPVRVAMDVEAPVCGVARQVVAVGPMGEVYPCNRARRFPAGNVRERPLAAIWADSEGMARLRAVRAGDFQACRTCRHFGLCRLCPATSALVNAGWPTGPNPADCQRARVLERLGALIH
ncbi:MAG: radical SAM protein [Planctomycetes bacterium]|nr:radical SAM protein [Planctomycetota bacterium]